MDGVAWDIYAIRRCNADIVPAVVEFPSSRVHMGENKKTCAYNIYGVGQAYPMKGVGWDSLTYLHDILDVLVLVVERLGPRNQKLNE
jgi:hypothetical protein